MKELDIAHAERVDSGVMVTFEDGRCALYSAALLLAAFPQAKEVPLLGGYVIEHLRTDKPAI